MSNDYFSKIFEAAEFIKSKISIKPEIAIILGSGLNSLADEIEEKVEIKCEEIPNFPVSTVEGHAGVLVVGRIEGSPIIAMKGRFHYYEGYEMQQVTMAVRVSKMIGVNNILVTNAAGGINKLFVPGDLMIIKDHIGCFAPSSLRGKNICEFGPRFPDMSKAYSKDLIQMAKEIAVSQNVSIKEGIYIYSQGPMYETPAEIRLCGIVGADAVGMSTVPEVVVANHCGMKVLGISCITNMAAGLLDQPLNHEEVIRTAKEIEKKFTNLVKGIIEAWKIKL